MTIRDDLQVLDEDWTWCYNFVQKYIHFVKESGFLLAIRSSKAIVTWIFFYYKNTDCLLQFSIRRNHFWFFELFGFCFLKEFRCSHQSYTMSTQSTFNWLLINMEHDKGSDGVLSISLQILLNIIDVQLFKTFELWWF